MGVDYLPRGGAVTSDLRWCRRITRNSVFWQSASDDVAYQLRALVSSLLFAFSTLREFAFDRARIKLAASFEAAGRQPFPIDHRPSPQELVPDALARA
jgi:hypothetical protein